MKDNLCGAIRMATDAHWGQVDKNGDPYILHPIRVMMKMDTEFERICAVLHDVLEDDKRGRFDFYEVENVYDVLVLLTREKDEPYMDYIKRLAENPVARKVKIADIVDNMDPERMNRLDPKTRERLSNKYCGALRYLLAHGGQE